MAGESANPELQTLLDHKAWVQDLARRLVRDPAGADDVAQEAMLAALRDPAAERRSVRAWLGTVVRNLVWERMRSEDRRWTRERGVARGESVSSTDELVERVSVHREVVEVVMTLPEHYRDVLLRRYYEGETPTEIAERQGVPVSTVKTRLARGLALMREKLDARHGGDGRAWLSALAPLVGAPVPRTGDLALPATAKAVVVVLGAATAAAGLFVLLRPDAPPRELGGAVAPSVDDVAGVSAPHDLSAIPEALAERSAEADPNVGSEDLSFAALNAAGRASLTHRSSRLTGRVLSVDGKPRGGVLVRFESNRLRADRAREGQGVAIAVAEPDGRFALEGARGAGRVTVASTDVVAVHAGVVDGVRSADGVTVLVAPRTTLAGRVVDGEGRPLADARVEVRLPRGLRARFARELERSTALGFVRATDAGGRFRFDDAPELEGSVLHVSREGFEPYDEPAGGATAGELRVTLHRPAASEDDLTGHVVGPDGLPVADARVSTGATVTRTDEDGVFHVDPGDAAELIALAPGMRPAVLAAERDAATGECLWPEPLTLRLEGPALSIRGRVVAPDGRGLGGIRVFVADPTVFRPGEKIADGSVSTFGRRLDDPTMRELPELVESALAGEPRVPWVFATTEEDGSFELGGLGARDYTLAAIDVYTLVRSEGPRVPGGSEGVVLTLDSSGLLPSVTGRVVDRDGRPVAGVGVELNRTVLELERDGETFLSEGILRGWRRTRGDGTFELDDVPREDVWLRLESEAIVPRHYGVRPGEELGPNLEIVVETRRHLRVTAPDAERVALLDADGEELDLLLVRGGRRVRLRRAELVEGRTEVLTVSDRAAELVLYADGAELRRAAIGLFAGGINDVQP